MSLRSEFRVVMFVKISTLKRCSVRLYLQLFVVGLMSGLHCLCLLVVSNTYCVVFMFCFSLSCVPYVASFSQSSLRYSLPFIYGICYDSNLSTGSNSKRHQMSKCI